MTLDTRLMRRSTPSQLRDYYKTLTDQPPGNRSTTGDSIAPEIEVTLLLIRAVERESVPPTVFVTWLGVSKSPLAIQKGLQQKFSIVIRKHSIKHLRKALCSSTWKQTWEVMEGAKGLLSLFHDLSVNEVRQACMALGKCGRGKDVLEKRKCITELFMGLQPHIFPDSGCQSADKRPLAKQYRHLIPSCTEEIVERIICGDLKGNWADIKEEYLMRYHPEVLQREQLRAVTGESGVSINKRRLYGLINQYPLQGVATLPHFSSSMEYSLSVLGKLSETKSSDFEDDMFINDLVRPLLSRAIERKAEWPRVQEIVDRTLQYLEKNPQAGTVFPLIVGDVHHLIARCWAAKPELFEQQLRRLCSHPEFGTSVYCDLEDWEDFLKGIPRNRCYALFQLCFQESTGLNIDDDEELKKAKGRLSQDLLTKFNPQESLSLLVRLRAARGDDCLAKRSNGDTVLDTERIFGADDQDPGICHVLLLSQNGMHDDCKRISSEQMEIRKKAAVLGSTPEKRAWHGKAVLAYAIASGDIELYKNALEWSKRFLRDPLVLRELYPRYVYPREVVTLLSGIPEFMGDLTKSKIRNGVLSGNTVMKSLFDTACSNLSEPSFDPYNWTATLNLFLHVVEERIEKSKRLKKLLGASDEEMYTMLWEKTIETLLAVEEKANWSEHQKMEIGVVEGPLDFSRAYKRELKTKDVSVFTFFDNLAKARNDYWIQLRGKVSGVDTLPKAFPRGLPIQHLHSPWTFDEPDLEQFAPYIASRAKAALFPDPADVLQSVPDDDQSKAAMGTFIDNYKSALSLYIPASCSKNERFSRIKKVWEFATGPLSQSRMSNEEAVRFWRSQLLDYVKNWPDLKYTQISKVLWPIIPEAEGQGWNPFEAGRPNRPSRKLDQVTYLDLSLNDQGDIHSEITLYTQRYDIDMPEVPAEEADETTIWDLSRNMGEGGVLSALLYLERNCGTSVGGLLEKPFPSEDDVRYPKLSLDPNFQDNELFPENAVRNIRGHLDTFPPSLLLKGATNMMGALSSSDWSEHEKGFQDQKLALNLIMRVEECDNPVLAQSMAIATVIHRPAASSWHRLLLKPDFFRRMPASKAQACFEKFADEIFKGLLRFDKKQDGISTTTTLTDSPLIGAPPPPPKVTTIKLLAQLLRGAEFVGEDLALSVLLRLLQEAEHVDIRLYTIKTLLSMLDTCSSDLQERVMSGVESIIPVAGNLDERHPLTEKDWEIAEETLTLPTHPQPTDGPSSIFQALIEQYQRKHTNGTQLHSHIDHVLLPTLESLKRDTTRWVSLFLKKHGFDDTESKIPPVPQRSDNIVSLLVEDGVSYMPQTLLEELVAYLKFNINPPESIKAFNKKLRSDPSLRLQPDTETWLSLYGGGVKAIESLGDFDLFSLFEKPTKLSLKGGIVPRIIQEQFLKLFTALVWADAPLFTKLSEHLLANILRGDYLAKPWWAVHGKPIISAMIAYINTIRTRDWERDVNRQPAVLPDTFPWRLLLLDYALPTKHDTNDKSEAKCLIFSDQLSRLIHDIGGAMYHAKLAQLKNYLALDPVSSKDDLSTTRQIGNHMMFYDKRDVLHDKLMQNRVITALYLGDISKTKLSWITSLEVLRVDVAAHLIELVSKEEGWDKIIGKQVMERVRQRLESWKACENEDVRRFGYEVEMKYSED